MRTDNYENVKVSCYGEEAASATSDQKTACLSTLPSKVNHLYKHIYPFFFTFFSHVDYYRVFPCAIQ